MQAPLDIRALYPPSPPTSRHLVKAEALSSRKEERALFVDIFLGIWLANKIHNLHLEMKIQALAAFGPSNSQSHVGRITLDSLSPNNFKCFTREHIFPAGWWLSIDLA